MLPYRESHVDAEGDARHQYGHPIDAAYGGLSLPSSLSQLSSQEPVPMSMQSSQQPSWASSHMQVKSVDVVDAPTVWDGDTSFLSRIWQTHLLDGGAVPQRSPPLVSQPLQHHPSTSLDYGVRSLSGLGSGSMLAASTSSPLVLPQTSTGDLANAFNSQLNISESTSPALPPTAISAAPFEPRSRSTSVTPVLGPVSPFASPATPSTAASTSPASSLRAAINAPQFVPRGISVGSSNSATSSPQVRPVVSPSQGPSPTGSAAHLSPLKEQPTSPSGASKPGHLKSTAAPFQPGRGTLVASVSSTTSTSVVAAGSERTSPSGKLTVQAAPFVPGVGRAGSLNAAGAGSMQNGLRSTAMPFQPGGKGGDGVALGGQGLEEGYADDAAYEEEETLGLVGDEMFDWSMGASSMPAPRKRSLRQMGVPEQLRQYLLMKDLDKLRAMAPDDERYKEIPPRYHMAYPLDDENKPRGATGAFGYPSVVYKVMDSEDGNIYALRRFDGVRTTPKIITTALETWKRIQHPNIIRLHKAFSHHSALFFVHEYCPEAQNVMQRFLMQRGGPRLRESHIWSILVQLVSAIRAVHANQSACRMIHPNYVLITTGNRVRLSCAGVADILEAETRKTVTDLQRADMIFLGRLVVMLATRTVITPQNYSGLLGLIAQAYSPEFHSLIVQLCTKPPTVFELCNTLTRHFMDELDRQYKMVDDLEESLGAEYESSRLFRLALKMSYVLERPHHAMDAQWAETGPRYILKLFRDYMYHQVDEEGKPVMDVGHVVHSLNKLDVGDPEKLLLMGTDQQTMIIVSFEEVKRCLEDAWMELCQAANFHPTIQEFGKQSSGPPGRHHQAHHQHQQIQHHPQRHAGPYMHQYQQQPQQQHPQQPPLHPRGVMRRFAA